MKYYKWTIVKDTPQVEKGFSYSFSDEILQRKCATCYSHDKELNDKIHWLRYYGENEKYSEYVKKEIDFDKAVENLRCPKCNNVSLFSAIINENRQKYISDVGTFWYDDVGLQCGICDWEIVLHSVCTKKKISW